MQELVFRPGTAADVDRLVEIHLSAYPDPRSLAARRRRFESPPFGHPDCVVVAERQGIIVGHALSLRMELAALGQWLPVTGVATIGVAPEARGQGVASLLVRHVEAQAAARGDLACVLYPFRQGFYARLGYAPASAYKRVGFVPGAVPRGWALGSDTWLRGPGAVPHTQIEALYDGVAQQRLGALRRDALSWQSRYADERLQWLFAGVGDRLLGYATFSPENDEPHARTTALVGEICAVEPRIERGLWAALGAQRSQITRFDIDVADDDPLPLALTDPDADRHGTATLEHAYGVVCTGPMLKLLNPAALLARRGYLGEREIDLAIGADALHLTVREGRGTVTVSAPGAAAISLSSEALGALCVGGVRAQELWAQGALSCGPAEVGALDSVFAGPRYFSRDPF
jgi:predicted acetyltransferase